jgi:hypothetical protein|tara:strand:- start:133 stop:348 length:216 start_codon:yes stop_codon:yes gene_type:complete
MPGMNGPSKVTSIKIKLLELEEAHRKIDNILSDMQDPILDPLILRRLKKEKLNLKDKIRRINMELTPNIIA